MYFLKTYNSHKFNTVTKKYVDSIIIDNSIIELRKKKINKIYKKIKTQ